MSSRQHVRMVETLNSSIKSHHPTLACDENITKPAALSSLLLHPPSESILFFCFFQYPEAESASLVICLIDEKRQAC